MSDPPDMIGGMETTTTATVPATGIARRSLGVAQRAAGGLPRPFWVLWAGTLINRLGMFVEPFLALYLSSERHLSLGLVGVVLASYGAGSVPSQLIGGALADRIGRRATLTAGMLANAAALLFLGYARGLGPLLVASLVVGLTIDLYRPAASALVADLVPAAERTRAFGLIFWAVNLGFSFAMVLGGTLARAGFTPLFWADAVTCAIFGLLVWRALPETLPTAADGEGTDGGFRAVFRDRLLVTFLLVMLIDTCVYMQAYTTLPLAMAASGLHAQSYGLAMAVNGLVIVALQPAAGAWLGRRDQSAVIAAGIGFLGLGYGLTALATTTWEYAACVAIWTIGEILGSATAAAVVSALAPPRLRGRYNGVFGLAFSLGYLIAPLAGTRLLAHGRPVLWLSCAAACAVAAAWQLALGPAIRRRERGAGAGATDRSG
jgi:MFS family permease